MPLTFLHKGALTRAGLILAAPFLLKARSLAAEPEKNPAPHDGNPLLFQVTDRRPNLIEAPLVKPWKTVPLNEPHGGSWVVTGDLDGDGEIELVSARDLSWWTGPHDKGGTPVHHACSVAVQKLDGTLLWTWGEPGKGERQAKNDVPCQVYDWNGDGKNEVVVIGSKELMIFEGATGKLLHSFPIPAFASDCVIAADLTGDGKADDFILKDRYFQMWGMRSDGKILWESPRTALIEGPFHLGHRPTSVDVNGDGANEIFAGFFMLNPDGTRLWDAVGTNQKKVIGCHMDGSAIIRTGSHPDDVRLAFTYCSGSGIGLVDGAGQIRAEVTGPHYESVKSGNIFPGRPAPHLGVDIDRAPMAIDLFDANLVLLGRLNLDYGRFFGLVDWDGDGFDELANADNGGIYNHEGKKIAGLDLGGDKGRFIQVADLDGDGIRDLLVVGSRMDKVYLFKNHHGAPGKDVLLGTGKNFTHY
ncbi:MAG: hypothetical protein FGM15_09305 [Chthoniobacterales bacterium]|nr:hypothetical protein [Chthoniobacterales bacterium]